MKFVLFVLSIPAWATEVAWFQFQVNHSYADSTTSCVSFRIGNPLYFAAEIESGTVVRGAFHTRPKSGEMLRVNADEMAGTELVTDSQGRFWLRSLPLNTRILKWSLYHVSYGSPIGCALPQTLQTVTPESVTLSFDPAEIEEFESAYSKRLSFSGLRADGDAFQAKVQFIQREFRFRLR